MIDITFDGSHPDIANSDLNEIRLWHVAYREDYIDKRNVTVNVLKIFDVTLPEIDFLPYK